MILHLKPATDDELQELGEMSQRNKDRVYDYCPTNILDFEIPFSEEEFAIAAQLKQVLAQGGRILILTPDSDIPQELTLEQEA